MLADATLSRWFNEGLWKGNELFSCVRLTGCASPQWVHTKRRRFLREQGHRWSSVDEPNATTTQPSPSFAAQITGKTRPQITASLLFKTLHNSYPPYTHQDRRVATRETHRRFVHFEQCDCAFFVFGCKKPRSCTAC